MDSKKDLMNRRNFFLISAAMLTAVGIPWAVWPDKYKAIAKSMPPPSTLSQLCDEHALVQVGSHYRKLAPNENKLSVLGKFLFEDTAGNIITDTEATSVNTLLEEKIFRDFEAGNTVIVDGWVLSLTEARQCAVYAMMH
jgi:hypothetical protein